MGPPVTHSVLHCQTASAFGTWQLSLGLVSLVCPCLERCQAPGDLYGFSPRRAQGTLTIVSGP